MDKNIKVITCPQCGAPIKPGATKCEYCGAEFFVDSVSYLEKLDKDKIYRYISYYKNLIDNNLYSGEANLGIGICYLDLQLYTLAIKHLRIAVEQMPGYADGYYYYAVALFKGRKPKILTLSEIRTIERYLNAAVHLNNKSAKYFYLWAIIKYEFYIENGFRDDHPAFEELIKQAQSCTCNRSEVNKMLQWIPLTNRYLLKLINNC